MEADEVIKVPHRYVAFLRPEHAALFRLLGESEAIESISRSIRSGA
jgi:hypothetical protein